MNKLHLNHIVLRAVSYLRRQIQLDGSFVYWRDEQGNEIDKHYNMLRHCGCVWAISCANKLFPDPDLERSIMLAARFIRSNMVSCETSESEGEMALVLDHGFAKLGGNALAYLALTESGLMDARLQQGLVNGLRFFLTSDAGIRFYKFSPHNGHITGLVSEYYPGEAALALCIAHEHELAEQLVRTLKITRDKDKVLQDHWLMQALECLMLHSFALPSDKSKLLQLFILNYYAEIFTEINTDRVYWGRNTPMACRAEGLLSYLSVLHKIGDVQTYIKARVLLDEIVSQLVTFQVDGGVLDGAFLDKNTARIDYTQHSLSVFLRYHQYQQAGIL